MKILEKISGALFGAKTQQTSNLSTGGNYQIEGKVAQIGNGVGVAITPDNRNAVGLFLDGGLISIAEQSGLVIEPWMASEAKSIAEKVKGHKKNMKDYCKSIRSISKDSVEMVDDFYSTKSKVSRNHVKQHQSHNRFLDTQDKNAGAMNYEEKRRDKERSRVETKLAAWEAKALASANNI